MFDAPLLPFVSVSVYVMCSPAAATNPLPSPTFLLTVTVKVCGALTGLVPPGPIVMLASTYGLVAGPEPPGPAPTATVAGSVSRVSVTPSAVNVTDAFAFTVPAVGDVNVTVHLPETVPAAPWPLHVFELMLNP